MDECLKMRKIFSQSLHLLLTSLLNVNGGIGSTKTTPTKGLSLNCLRSSCYQTKIISHENWFGTERHLIYRRTGLEAELRARAVGDEGLIKTVGLSKEGKHDT